MIKLTKRLAKKLVDVNSINIWLKEQRIKSTKDLLWDYYEIYDFIVMNNFLSKIYIVIDKLPENLTQEDIQEFINHNNILTLKKIKYSYTKIYDRIIDLDIFYKLTYSNGKNDWVEFSSVEQEQKFIDNHNITRSRDFIKDFPEMYKFTRTIHQFLSLKFKNDIDDDSLYNSIDEFQDLIYNDDIKTCEEFEIRYPNVYNKMVNLRYRSLLIFTKFNRHDLKWVQTVEDYKEFIEVSGITSRGDAIDMFGKDIRRKISEEGWMDKIGLEFPTNDWSWVKSIDDIQDYIDKNNIESYKELREKFLGLKGVMVRKHWSKENLVFKKQPYLDTSWITSVEVAQEYVDRMGYKNSHEFSSDKEHNGDSIYRKLTVLGFAKYIKYPNPICRNLEFLSTIEDAEKFIKENNIKNSVDFFKRFGSEYNRLGSLNLLEKIRPFYVGHSSEFLSSWEETFYESLKNFLDKQGIIYNIQCNIKIPDLKDKGDMRVDLKLEVDSNIFLFELQGPTHFFDIYKNMLCFVKRRKHDIIKKRWSNKNNMKLFFFTYDKELLNKYSFPYYVYTSEEELFSDLSNAIKLT